MDNSGIRLLSRKERNANFRTAAHNMLIKSDDQYDARYHATTLVHTKLWALYNTVLSALTSEALCKAELSFKQFCTATAAKRNRVFVTLSGWSATDRRFAMGRLRSTLQSEAMVIECTGDCYGSAVEVLNEIKGNLKLYDTPLTSREPKRARTGKYNDETLPVITEAIENSVFSYIYNEENIDCSVGKHPTLVIILRSSEKMSPAVFGNLLESLDQAQSVRFFFMMDHFSSCPLPVPSDSGHRSLLEVDMTEIPSTLEFYDKIMVSLLSMDLIPIQFPESVLASLRIAFDDNDRCINSLVSRMCMYVTSHFRYRQALLCVSAEHKLMAELRLLPGKSKDDSAKQTKSIQSLLPYLSMDDLRDSGLLVHRKNTVSLPTEGAVFEAMSELSRRCQIDRILLRFIHRVRNSVLPDTEQLKWRVDKLWIGIKDAQCTSDRSSSISQLCATVKSFLPGISMTTLSSLLVDWKESLSSLAGLFEATENHAESSGSGNDTYVSSCEWLNRVKNLELVLDYLKASMVDSEVCIANNLSEEDSLRTINRKLCALDIPALTESVEMTNVPQLRIDDSLACFIDDIYESLLAFVSNITALPRPSELPGIVTLSHSSCSLGNSYLNGNMRKMISWSLQCPNALLKGVSESADPDMCSLFYCLQNFGKGGTMTALYDSFHSLAPTWDLVAPEIQKRLEELKKRVGRKQGTQLESSIRKDQIKCRFLDAVYEFQRSSFIKVTNNGKSFQKISNVWLYDDL